MSLAASNIQGNQGIVSQAIDMSQRVVQAIQQASARAGVDFAYMLNKAVQESGLNPDAKAKTSSATGLFQFIEQTWLRTVKAHGEKYGLGDVADSITIGADGVARVKDSQTKKAILALRKDPSVSACMAAELTNENKEALESKTGCKAGSTELYLAHFLGAGGATQFLKAMQANPNAKASDVLPEAAATNGGVFFDKSGQSKTLAQVYERFAHKFDKAPETEAAMSNGGLPVRLASVSVPASTEYQGSLSAMSGDFVTPLLSPSPVMNSRKADSQMSSPFAAMMLAQMDVGEMALPSESIRTVSEDEEKRKQAFGSQELAG